MRWNTPRAPLAIAAALVAACALVPACTEVSGARGGLDAPAADLPIPETQIDPMPDPLPADEGGVEPDQARGDEGAPADDTDSRDDGAEPEPADEEGDAGDEGEESAPDGWGQDEADPDDEGEVADSPPEVTPDPAVCLPCRTAADCGPAGGAGAGGGGGAGGGSGSGAGLSCADLGGFSHCLPRCDGGAACPAGLACGAGGVCAPVGGTCGCTAVATAAGATGACRVSNAHGACKGEFSCPEDGGGPTACSAAVPEAEVCDGKDQDCDGVADDGVKITFFADEDGDGFGRSTFQSVGCVAPEGFVPVPGDCDDTDPTAWPGAPEACNGVDDDCDGETDEDAKPTWHADADGDGFGDPDLSVTDCTPPDGFVLDGTDCDDLDETVSPLGTEICGGADEDCDGETDEVDADGDGARPTACLLGEDCDDSDPFVGPAGVEICNGRDDDCDGETDEVDADGDGSRPVECGGDDCDDADPWRGGNAVEVCNAVDDDCDALTDESDPAIDFATDPANCGGCGVTCGTDGLGSDCVEGGCGSLPVRQHRWQSVTSVDATAWAAIQGADAAVRTRGGPLEIELSIPLVGGDHSACRPTVDGKWAGAFQALPEAYGWHEGLDRTGWASGKARRTWKRTRVYAGIPAGTHTVGVQCRTDYGTLQVGRTGATALWIAREFLAPNKVWQQVSLTYTTVGVTGAMQKVPGTDLVVTTSGKPIEITISLPLGQGGHVGCLEFMDNAPITTAYANTYWYAGIEASYRGWIMWHHTRTYPAPAAGQHTFSIRCYNDSGTLYAGYPDMASVLIVKEIDESRFPSAQALDAYGNGWAIEAGAEGKWYPMPGYQVKMNVTRGAVEIDAHLDHYNVLLDRFFTCRPLIDGQWAGAFSGVAFASVQEEGSQREVFEGTGWHGMWHRRRAYGGIPPGEHLFSLECMSSGAGYYAGHHSVASFLVREADLVADD